MHEIDTDNRPRHINIIEIPAVFNNSTLSRLWRNDGHERHFLFDL